MPFVIKPVDSSDTKGVFCIDQREQIDEVVIQSSRFSRSGRLIAEEFIDADTVNLHGDGFVLDGKLAFTAIGKVMFYSEVTQLKPTATWYPGDIEARWIEEAQRQINMLLKVVGFKEGPINIEARVDKSGTLYLMEIGPRSGGGMTPQTIHHAYGFDMLAANFDLLERKPVVIQPHAPRHTLLMVLHVNQSGRVSQISYEDRLAPYLVESSIQVKSGDWVKSYDQPGSSLGACIYQFEDDHLLRFKKEELYHSIIGQIVLDQAESASE